MSELLRAVMQITDTVYPIYKAYIEPDLNTAHLKIYNNFNPFSGFMAPTYILKSAKRVVPEQIKAVLKVRTLMLATTRSFQYLPSMSSQKGTIGVEGGQSTRILGNGDLGAS